MKKLSLVLALGLLCSTTLFVKADDSATDKKAARKALVEKYDTDKNGKLSKDEIAKMTPEDKASWDKVAGMHKKKDASTNAPATDTK
jgi:hypothetical protein